MCRASREWRLAEPPEAETDSPHACFVLADEGQPKGPLVRRVGRAFTYSWASFIGLAKYILLGVAIAGAIKVLLPGDPGFDEAMA